MESKDIDLILKAQKGDGSSVEELFEHYKYFIASITRKFFLVGGDNDDLTQEGMVGFFKAVSTYDLSKNDNFLAYAKTVIIRHLYNVIKSANSNKFSVLNESVNLTNQGAIESENSDEGIVLGDDNLSPENTFISDENLKNIQVAINNCLSSYEKTIFNLYLKGYNYTDIANKLNTNKKSVDNALSRIKSKLQFLKGLK